MSRTRWILFGILVLVLVAGAVTRVTWAYFSDLESSSENQNIGSTNWATPAWYQLSPTSINYYYRRPITITNSGSAVNNYPLKLDISLPAANVNSDLSDLRFTSSNGTSTLSFWIDPLTVNSTTISGVPYIEAEVWVKVNVLRTALNPTMIYMYYGYKNATSASNGSNVFTYFNDFESGSVGSGWNFSGFGTYSVIDSGDSRLGKVLYLNDNNASANRGYTAYYAHSNMANVSVGFAVQPLQTGALWEMSVNSGTTRVGYMDFSVSGNNIDYITSGPTVNPIQSYNSNTVYNILMDRIRSSVSTYDIYIDGEIQVSGAARYSSFSNITREYFRTSTTAAQDPDLYIDNMHVAISTPNTITYVIQDEQ